MSNQNILALFTPLMSYVLFLKRHVSVQQFSFESVKESINHMLEESANQVRQKAIDPRDFDDARFAICTWLDETLLGLSWMHRDEWCNNLIQTEVYQTSQAGEQFFDRLNKLSDAQVGVREVYYACLSLGLVGRFCRPGDEILLEQLRNSQFRKIMTEEKYQRLINQSNFFPDAYPSSDNEPDGERKTEKLRRLITLISIVAPVAILIALYLLYSFTLNGLLDNLLSNFQST